MATEIDFEGTYQANDTTKTEETNKANPDVDTQDIDKGNVDKVDINDDRNITEPDNNKEPDKTDDDIVLQEGYTLEYGDDKYTVDKNGNVIDKNGNVFKRKEEVKDWLKNLEIEQDTETNDDDDSTLHKIQNALGVTIVDDDEKEVNYEDNIDGIVKYVNDVITQKTQTDKESVINTFMQQNPIVEEFINYIGTYGTYEGFGEIQDRRNVELDKDNEEQLEAIIKIAAREFGNKSLDDNYIKYLKNTGSLYDVAKDQLDALINLDKQKFEAQRQENERLEQERREQVAKEAEMWANKITSKQIGDFTLPDSIQKEINGKKYTLNLNDFVNYLTKPAYKNDDGNVFTQYQIDSYNRDNEDVINDTLMLAWIRFTGGNLKDLAKYIHNGEAVKKLKIKSNEMRSQRTIKVKSKPQKVDMNDILLT